MESGESLHSFTHYAKQLRAELPHEIFERSPSRLLWLPVHLGVIAAGVSGILLGNLGWGWNLALALVIGHSYGVLGFLGHEILHGSIVKDRNLQNWLGGLCMLHYCIGPTHWRTWHNKFHHCHTTQGQDPDSFGNIRTYRAYPIIRELVKFAPGSGHKRSWLFLSFWLSLQAMWVLFVHSRHFEYWPAARRRRQMLLFGAMVAFWAGVFALVGPYNFVWIYLVPLAVANALQMSYIATNHMISDETEDVNDPLANSLTVRVPRWVDCLHLNFSYHVEHHIFPAMNPRHAPLVKQSLLAKFGSQYRDLPMLKALWGLYHTPPVHLSRSEFVDLHTGDVYSTVGEHGRLPEKIDKVPVPVRPRRRSDADAAAAAHAAPAAPDVLPFTAATEHCERRAA